MKTVGLYLMDRIHDKSSDQDDLITSKLIKEPQNCSKRVTNNKILGRGSHVQLYNRSSEMWKRFAAAFFTVFFE